MNNEKLPCGPGCCTFWKDCPYLPRTIESLKNRRSYLKQERARLKHQLKELEEQ